MSRIELKSISTSDSDFFRESTVVVNVSGNFDNHNGLEQDLTLTRNEHGKWIAQIALDDFPSQNSPEEAVERLSLWLKTLSKSLNKNQFKKLNISKIINPIHF